MRELEDCESQGEMRPDQIRRHKINAAPFLFQPHLVYMNVHWVGSRQRSYSLEGTGRCASATGGTRNPWFP